MSAEVATVTRTLDEARVDLGAGRCLHVRLVRSTEGAPEELSISEGWHDGGEDRRRSIGPLPGWALVGLRDVLAAMGRD